MAKKALFFVFVFVLISLTINFVSAADIGFVVKTPSPVNADETAIINLLEEDGNDITLLDDVIFNADLYDIIIVGEDVTNIDNIFDNKNHKTIFLSQGAAKYAGLSKYNGFTSGNKVTISNNEAFITEGFSLGDLTVYKSFETINYVSGCRATNSKSLAYKSDNTQSVILILETDSLLLDETGNCAKRNVPIYERNIFFGLPRASQWEDNTKNMFLNSITWMLYGEDSDGDGYYYDEDCDDNNANKWQLIEGYLDNDLDGYGSEELLDVCSGDELLEGYSYIDGDCDDSFASCNADCVSLNYLDADEDGYGNLNMPHRACDASPNYVSDSNDCNDDDNEINPNAEEMQYDMIDSNCDGAAEFSGEIPDIEWNEDEKTSINLNSYIWNPKNNQLEFYVYDTSDDVYISIGDIENEVVNFSSDENWYGDDWIIFAAYDESIDINIISNEIILRVLPTNDAPEFIREIENITWNEDTNLTNYLDLNDYFYDIDEDELTFSVTGNNFINVILNNGLVSFITDSDWFGSEIIKFIATDGEDNIESNEINLTVNDANEPPEFGEINCLLDIDEDTIYTCTLNASDFEGDDLEFSIAGEDNINCDVDENELEYISDENHNGEASCMIKVNDGSGYDEYLLEVNVLPINDAPEIRSYNPAGTPKIMENTSQIFSVTAFDVDGDDLNIKWFLDDIEIGSGNTYVFNEEKGNYNLIVSIADNIADPITKTWNVFVGDISDFTCEEVDGYTIGEKEICLGNLLQTSDSNLITCCSIPGQPKFSDVERCKNLSSNLKIKIEKPDENDKFKIGNDIIGKIKIENNFDEDLDFDVNFYLYDITNDEEIENYEDSVSVNKDENEELNFELLIPEDIDEKNDYAIFVKAIDEDESYCNQEYIPIDIQREKHDVVIKEANLDSEVTCGDYFDAEIRVQNLGSKDADVYLLIENSDLNISEKSEEFELEKYDESDTATKTFSIKTPEDAKEGDYDIEIKADFGNGESSITKTLSVRCKKIEETKQEIEKIQLKTKTTQAQTKDNKWMIILLGIIMLSALIIIIILLNIGFNKKH